MSCTRGSVNDVRLWHRGTKLERLLYVYSVSRWEDDTSSTPLFLITLFVTNKFYTLRFTYYNILIFSPVRFGIH